MSHEIRTPINAVLGMNEMILHKSNDINIREYASNIQNSGRTLLSLINSILDFSKIEDNKMKIIPVEYHTAVLINDLVNSVAARAAEKELKLIVEADELLPSVLLGDEVRIKQIILNLLTNAVNIRKKVLSSYATTIWVTTSLSLSKTPDAESQSLHWPISSTASSLVPVKAQALAWPSAMNSSCGSTAPSTSSLMRARVPQCGLPSPVRRSK